MNVISGYCRERRVGHDQAHRIVSGLPYLLYQSPKVFRCPLDPIEPVAELFMIEFERAVATIADKVIVTAKPSDSLRVMLSAPRAVNLDLETIEELLGILRGQGAIIAGGTVINLESRR